MTSSFLGCLLNREFDPLSKVIEAFNFHICDSGQICKIFSSSVGSGHPHREEHATVWFENPSYLSDEIVLREIAQRIDADHTIEPALFKRQSTGCESASNIAPR
jgi:hypothetical protein